MKNLGFGKIGSDSSRRGLDFRFEDIVVCNQDYIAIEGSLQSEVMRGPKCRRRVANKFRERLGHRLPEVAILHAYSEVRFAWQHIQGKRGNPHPYRDRGPRRPLFRRAKRAVDRPGGLSYRACFSARSPITGKTIFFPCSVWTSK